MDPLPLTHWEGRSVEAWRREWSLPELEVYDTIGSTNDRARELGERGAETGTTVLAEEQTAGRGRRGRRWLAPPRTGLLLSMIFRYEAPPGGPGAAPLRVALATGDAVRDATGILPDVKWPNDLLIHGRKVAGILCEGATGGPGHSFLIAGIGLNVGQRHDDWPDELLHSATSLACELQRPVRHVYLAGWLLDHLRRIAPSIAHDLAPPQLQALRQRDALRGRRIRVDQEAPATALGIHADGSLLIRDAQGARRTVRTGSIILLD